MALQKQREVRRRKNNQAPYQATGIGQKEVSVMTQMSGVESQQQDGQGQGGSRRGNDA